MSRRTGDDEGALLALEVQQAGAQGSALEVHLRTDTQGGKFPQKGKFKGCSSATQRGGISHRRDRQGRGPQQRGAQAASLRPELPLARVAEGVAAAATQPGDGGAPWEGRGTTACSRAARWRS